MARHPRLQELPGAALGAVPRPPQPAAGLSGARRTGGPEIAKPFWGREGANIRFPAGRTPGPYAHQPTVWQSYAELPCFGGRFPVLGSWVVAGRPCGLGIREDATPITRDTSRFVPHLFPPQGPSPQGSPA